MKVLVTGSAGFIGSHLVKRLLERGDEVVGFDNLNYYYDIRLKYGRLKQTGVEEGDIRQGEMVPSRQYKNYRFVQESLESKVFLDKLFKQENFDVVVNLAAQAGVRYSITNPDVYMSSNVQGFFNILEACRNNPVKHLVFASSSSVYGLNEKMPFSINESAAHPISLYAASKKSNEVMAHTYSHLFRIPTTGLRFFTVYGPWGRPDMALFIFTKSILEGKPIPVFNYGDMARDFTYVADIVEGVVRVIDNPAKENNEWDSKNPDPASSTGPYKLYNIGNSSPVRLLDFIEALEEALGKKAIKELLPLQPGDVHETWADVDNLKKDMGYQPSTSIKDGVQEFVNWYTNFYK
jgi:UDP-glucuronate 4-epimerase